MALIYDTGMPVPGSGFPSNAWKGKVKDDGGGFHVLVAGGCVGSGGVGAGGLGPRDAAPSASDVLAISLAIDERLVLCRTRRL